MSCLTAFLFLIIKIQMQANPAPTKAKYKIKDYVAQGNAAINKFSYAPKDGSCKLYCICNKFSLVNSRKCKRCKGSFDSCVIDKMKKQLDWQCLHCQSQYMDPIFWPADTLLQTFFQTETVTQYCNIIQFVFYLSSDQAKKPVEIRCLQKEREGLAWPMHGQFYINKQQFPEPVIDFKPLLKNSNRKYRKQQAILLPSERLRVGKNILNFIIPKLNGQQFGKKYQIELKGLYFLGIYSINKFSKEQVIKRTYESNVMDKQSSLLLLREFSGEGDLTVEKTKICLECPYMKSRIKIPIRGKKCKHYLCICLDTLIQTRAGMNSREWKCPICSSDINQPVVDLFILSILNDGKAGLSVELDTSGKYEWITFEDDDNISLDSDTMEKKLIKKQNILQSKKEKQQTSARHQFLNDHQSLSKKDSLASEKKNSSQKQPQTKFNQNIARPASTNIQTNSLQNEAQTICIDDDEQPQSIQKNQKVEKVDLSKKNLSSTKSNMNKAVPIAQKTVQNKPNFVSQLEIMIPKQKKSFDRGQSTLERKQLLKEKLKQKKSREQIIQFERLYPRKQELVITDIREMVLKPMDHRQFTKKYLKIEYSRVKVSEDLKAIFKEVL